MNGISNRRRSGCPTNRARRGLGLLAALLVAACSAPASEDQGTPAGAESLRYGLAYTLSIEAEAQAIDVAVTVSQGRSLLREMRFDAPADRLSALDGDGEVRHDGGRVTWLPPETGGSLRWRIEVPSRRGDGGFDAWLDSRWGIFRAEDAIPRAATRTLRGAESTTSLKIEVPDGWSAVTEYAIDDGRYAVERPGRRFSQPAGWIAVGKLGVRRETVEGIPIAVAAPVGQSVRRMDILAMSNWVLPALVRLLPEPPTRITVIGAGDPMWRGGLSGPQSVFLHADRPMISENGTSTLVHELLHVSFGLASEPGYDWVVEGLAEFYSLELLRRSGTISERRYERSLESIAEWSQDAGVLCAPSSTGATTALAVTVFDALNRELAAKTDGAQSLDDVLYDLLESGGPVSLAELAEASGERIGGLPDALRSRRLPGCPALAADSSPGRN